MRRRQVEDPPYEEVVDFLTSIQDQLFFASGRNPDVDVFSDDDEEEDE
jgi:hypothetical protein